MRSCLESEFWGMLEIRREGFATDAFLAFASFSRYP